MSQRTQAILGLAIAAALLPACYEETSPETELSPGAYTVAFEGARYQVTEGEGDPEELEVSAPFEVDGNAYFMTIEDSSDYCFLEGGSEPATTYSILCNYIGPVFSLSFGPDQLYDGHPEGTIIGPSTEIELWGQFSPTMESIREVEVPEEPTPSPTPSPSPSEDGSRWSFDEDPTPEEEAPTTTVTAICSRTVAHSFYGQLKAVDSFTGLLTIIDTTYCVDEEGVNIPSAYQRVVFEGQGTFTKAD